MNRRVYLGIDTSNYTTSLAIIDDSGVVLEDRRMLLQVPKHQQGLRQSEALFQHVKNLPELMEHIHWSEKQQQWALAAIGVSAAPRPLRESYMPVFLAGLGMARSLTAVIGAEMVTTTHQESHLWAALHSAKGPRDSEFLAMHVSGGTSDLLRAKRQKHQLTLTMVGTSTDLHAGQMVDRVGVALGLGFPAGPSLERMAASSIGELRLPSSVKQGSISFSGPCAQALRLVGKEPPEDIAKAVLLCIARSLEKALRWCFENFGNQPVLASGGVLSNALIRRELSQRLPFIEWWYAAPYYSVDNALGAAVVAWTRAAEQPWERCLFGVPRP